MRAWIALVAMIGACALARTVRAEEGPIRDAGAVAPAEPQPADESAPEPDDDFAPMLMVFALLAVVVILLLVGAGAVLALACLGILALFAALGIVTTSTLAGLRARSLRPAFRALFLQALALAGAFAGAGAAWLVTLAGWTEASLRAALLVGGAAGLAFGVVAALLFNRAWGGMLDLLVRRFGRPG